MTADTVYNGEEIFVSHSAGGGWGSIGFPVIWGVNGVNKGWLTAGHVAHGNGNPVTYSRVGLQIGVTSNCNIEGIYDAATILRNSSSFCLHHTGHMMYSLYIKRR